jgi:hypothetical protein
LQLLQQRPGPAAAMVMALQILLYSPYVERNGDGRDSAKVVY